MTGDELNDLAALWNDTSGEAERREVAALARRTPARARALMWGELGVCLLLAVVILAAIILQLGLSTLLVGSLILVLLGWSAWTRHRLGHLALLIDDRDRLSFLCSSERAKQAELRRSAVGLAFILPVTLLTTLLGFALNDGADGGSLGSFLALVTTTPRGLVALAFLACATMLLTLSHLRLGRELANVRDLRRAYEEEAALDARPPG